MRVCSEDANWQCYVFCFTKGEFPQGCTVFKAISPNVESEESGMRDDSGMQDASYSEVRY